MTESLFLSPKARIHGVILGAGPIFLLPTATEKAVGAGASGGKRQLPAALSDLHLGNGTAPA
jgi:hypothetical protein